ncbi:MAG: signal peptide peptidase SppA [Verrucomicrobiota bacterium]
MIGGLVLIVMAQSSLGWSLGRTGRQTGRWLEEVTVESNGSNNKVAIIDVEGIITSMSVGHRGRNMVDLIEDQLKMAARDEDVHAVILKVDSPGGEVLASDDISRALLDFQEKHRKPVVAAMGGLGASGGYYVSAPCQWIIANELTMTGSIGVIMSTFNYRGLLDKVGVYPQVFKSGRFKDMLRGSKKPEEIDPEEQRMIQSMIDETYSKFVAVVQAGRDRAKKENKGEGKVLASNWKDYADGRVLTGRQAFDLGFVDELGGFDAAVQRARKLAKIPDANLVRYQEPFGLGNFLSLFGKSDGSGVKVDFGFQLPKIQAGRLYFLSPTVLH